MKKLLLFLAITGSVLCEESSQEQPETTLSTNNNIVVMGSDDESIMVWDIEKNKLYYLRNTNEKIEFLIKKQVKLARLKSRGL